MSDPSFRSTCDAQDNALALRIGRKPAALIIEDLPDWLRWPWAYAGGSDTFDRRKVILDAIDERGQRLDCEAEAYLGQQAQERRP